MALDRILQSNNLPRSLVWLGTDGWVYKQQCKYMAQNEIYALVKMYPTGFVPYAEQIDNETIKMDYIRRIPIENWTRFNGSVKKFIKALKTIGIKHGDLTKYAIIPVSNNTFKVIDWATSRPWFDPRPPKRPGDDREWLMKAIAEMRKDAGL